MDKNKYVLKLRCVNCFTNFEYEFTKGFRVEERGYTLDTKHIQNEENEYIKCPCCGCTNIIKVRD